MPADRRRFLRNAGLAAISAGTLGACAKAPSGGDDDPATRRFEWHMVTAWPSGFPGLADGAARLAQAITRASGGRLTVQVHDGGERVAPFDVFDAVADGRAEMGHSAAYYWRAKAPAAPFFCTVPFGFNAQEMNAWLQHGGGLALWRELYGRFGLVPFPAGNTGVQMAAWSNREISSAADLGGLRIRMPGLGGEVMARVGAVPVNLPGAEIFAALQSGKLDAAEWLGPSNDLAFGLHRAARYCYWPGWQEPGCTIECIVNAKALSGLPDDLQAIIATCCAAANDEMLADFTARNARAMATLVDEHGIQFRRLPESALTALRRASEDVLDEIAAADAFARRVYDAYRAFRGEARAWHAVSELAYYQTRG